MEKFHRLSSKDIRKEIEKNNLFEAILEASVTLEDQYFQQLVLYGIYPKLIKSWSLGKLKEFSEGLNLAYSRYKNKEVIEDFMKLRNFAVHDGKQYFEAIPEDRRNLIKKILLEVCEYIDNSLIENTGEDMWLEFERYHEGEFILIKKILDKYEDKKGTNT